MSTRPPDGGDLPVRRIDRILAFMSLGLLVLSFACFLTIIIATAADADFSQGVLPVVGIVLYIAPPLAFLLILAVLIVSFIRRGRANRGL
jgi:FtsH-binding integral membrane protein